MEQFLVEEQYLLNQIIKQNTSYEDFINIINNLIPEDSFSKNELDEFKEKVKNMSNCDFEYIKKYPFKTIFEN